MEHKKKISSFSRTEPCLDISEFHLSKPAVKSQAISVTSLTKNIKNRKALKKTEQEVKKIARTVKPLPKPTDVHLARKTRRIAGYRHVKEDMKKWNPVVTANRANESMKFPLNYREYKMESLVEFFDKQNDEKSDTIIEPEKNNILKLQLNKEEMMTKIKQLARIRAMESYEVKRNQQQNKIKSKKYRKLLKKQKLQKKLKEFEELRANDPEKALEKLEELERIRVKERMTLRHRSIGKWAKGMQAKAKYSADSRKELAEQLSLSRKLTEKPNLELDSDEENASNDDGDDEKLMRSKLSKSHSWFKSQKTKDNNDSDHEEDFDQAMAELKAFDEQHCIESIKSKKTDLVLDVVYEKTKSSNIRSDNNKGKNKKPKSSNDQIEETVNDIKSIINELGTDVKPDSKRKKTKQKSTKKSKMDDLSFPEKVRFANDEGTEELLETTCKNIENSTNTESKVTRYWDQNDKKKSKQKVPEKSEVTLCKTVQNLDTEMAEVGEDFDDNCEIAEIDENQKRVLMEAFADDNVVADFRKDKRAEIKANQSPELNLGLPGWGSWVGGKKNSIKKCLKRKRRFIIKMPKPEKRRDENKGFLIINEDLDQEKMKKHQVSDLPHPFKRVADFEDSIKQSIGPTFVSELTHLKLTAPKVLTKSGIIIEPMDKSVLLKN